ncbi:MAG: hypothetical protein KatS3mg009_1207 [Acidimicrobiia bacterium]|nr:MAG: hypothetical protein KatS3mg009_1207 [Acidimicrobiia bacterium]
MSRVHTQTQAQAPARAPGAPHGRAHRRGSPRAAAAVALGCALALLAGCGDGARTPQVVEYVVPEGTATRIARGEQVTIMPDTLELRVGDTLRIRNEDVAGATVGPYYVEAGREFTLTYGAPGVFAGACELSEGGTFRIVVTQ